MTSCFYITPATTEVYTLSLHDALPIWSEDLSTSHEWYGNSSVSSQCDARGASSRSARSRASLRSDAWSSRSEEHTSELQSRENLVCRLLLEKKKKENSNSGVCRSCTSR